MVYRKWKHVNVQMLYDAIFSGQKAFPGFVFMHVCDNERWCATKDDVTENGINWTTTRI